MKTRFLIILVFGLMTIMGFSILPVYGLSCALPLFTESYEGHDILLHGTLVEKEILLPIWENQKLTTLTFDTITVYKGEFTNTFTVEANLSWDDYYRIGEEYVLFADKDGDDYLRDLCVPNYIASKAIIKFLDEYFENPSDIDTRSLYDVVQGFERDDLDIKRQTYSNLNRNDVVNNPVGSGYVVSSGEYTMTWFGALQLLIIISIIGIPVYVIYRRKRK
jgi:hypothetical protein